MNECRRVDNVLSFVAPYIPVLYEEFRKVLRTTASSQAIFIAKQPNTGQQVGGYAGITRFYQQSSRRIGMTDVSE
jgi:hypothetical protein